MTENDDRIISSHELKKELENTPKRTFFSSGFSFLNEIVGQFAIGDLIFVGGLPGSGKTTLLQTFTRTFAAANIPSLWFSIELSAEEFLGRFGENLPVFYVPRVIPSPSTHEWIENKIREAIEKHKVQVVFIDDIGMIIDESVARHQNNVDIFDARVQRLKRFANDHKITIIAVSAVQQEQLKKKNAEPSMGDFRGTAMVAYRADILLYVKKLSTDKTFRTVNEDYLDVNDFKNDYLMNTDTYLYVLKSRRTGISKSRIKLSMDPHGDLKEI